MQRPRHRKNQRNFLRGRKPQETLELPSAPAVKQAITDNLAEVASIANSTRASILEDTFVDALLRTRGFPVPEEPEAGE